MQRVLREPSWSMLVNRGSMRDLLQEMSDVVRMRKEVGAEDEDKKSRLARN